jgi:hypothetical protein
LGFISTDYVGGMRKAQTRGGATTPGNSEVTLALVGPHRLEVTTLPKATALKRVNFGTDEPSVGSNGALRRNALAPTTPRVPGKTDVSLEESEFLNILDDFTGSSLGVQVLGLSHAELTWGTKRDPAQFHVVATHTAQPLYFVTTQNLGLDTDGMQWGHADLPKLVDLAYCAGSLDSGACHAVPYPTDATVIQNKGESIPLSLWSHAFIGQPNGPRLDTGFVDQRQSDKTCKKVFPYRTLVANISGTVTQTSTPEAGLDRCAGGTFKLDSNPGATITLGYSATDPGLAAPTSVSGYPMKCAKIVGIDDPCSPHGSQPRRNDSGSPNVVFLDPEKGSKIEVHDLQSLKMTSWSRRDPNTAGACTASASCYGHFQMKAVGGGSRLLHVYNLDLADAKAGVPSDAIVVDVDQLGGTNSLTFDTTTAPATTAQGLPVRPHTVRLDAAYNGTNNAARPSLMDVTVYDGAESHDYIDMHLSPLPGQPALPKTWAICQDTSGGQGCGIPGSRAPQRSQLSMGLNFSEPAHLEVYDCPRAPNCTDTDPNARAVYTHADVFLTNAVLSLYTPCEETSNSLYLDTNSKGLAHMITTPVWGEVSLGGYDPNDTGHCTATDYSYTHLVLGNAQDPSKFGDRLLNWHRSSDWPYEVDWDHEHGFVHCARSGNFFTTINGGVVHHLDSAGPTGIGFCDVDDDVP